MKANRKVTPIEDLAPFDEETGLVQVMIETPRGSRNKFKYNEQLGVFELHHVLPAGAVFPYDFGYVPGTRAADGDPLDVLILMDESAFVGCLVRARLIGVIEATQTEADGSTCRNDRLVAVADAAHDWKTVRSLKDVDKNLLQEIEHFFVSYNEARGKRFELLGCRGHTRARRLLLQAMEQHDRH